MFLQNTWLEKQLITYRKVQERFYRPELKQEVYEYF